MSASSSSSTSESALYTDEVKFAKLLVHPDKKVRDDTLDNLQRYLKSPVVVSSFDDFAMLKLWKALYYCLWLADKAPIQQELIGRIASITTVFASVDVSVLFLQQFYRILFREWSSLDQYRVDKFYSLIRSMLSKMLLMIVDSCYSEELMNRLLQLLYCEALVKRPNGIRFHIADIFIEELYKVTGGVIRTTAFVALLNPFLRIITNVAEQGVFADRIYKQVFTKYLAEYSIESYNKRKDSLGSGGDVAAASEATAATDGSQESSHNMFPQVQSLFLQKRVFDLASTESTGESCRKKLYCLHKQLSATTGCDFVGDDYDVQALEAAEVDNKDNRIAAIHGDDGKIVDDAAPQIVSSSAVVRKSKKLKRSATEDLSKTGAAVASAVINDKDIDATAPLSAAQRPLKRTAQLEQDQGLSAKKAHVVAAVSASTIVSTDKNSLILMSRKGEAPVPGGESLFIASKVFAGRREGYKFQKVCATMLLSTTVCRQHHHHLTHDIALCTVG